MESLPTIEMEISCSFCPLSAVVPSAHFMGPYEPSPTALRVRTPCEASKIVTAFNQSLPIGKLPFWPTVVSAYRITIVNAATFVRPSWVWLLIGLVLIASLNPILWSPEAVQQAMSGPYPGMYYWMREIGFFALAGPIAVHWHNWVLKNDRFRWHHGFEYARRSTIYFIVLMLIVALPNETSSYLFERYFGPSASNIEPQWLKYATVAVLMLAALAITVLSLSQTEPRLACHCLAGRQIGFPRSLDQDGR